MRWIHRNMPDFAVPIDITAEQANADLRASGAVRWANALLVGAWQSPALHTFGAALADRVPEMTPFGGVHVEDNDSLAVAQEAIEGQGMAGLKFDHMVKRFEPWDERLTSVIDYLQRQRRPLCVHIGI